MTRKKPPTNVTLVRSTAAEYLTFVAARGQGGVEAVYTDENVWRSQKMMAQLCDVAESEVEKYRIVQDRLFESDFGRVVAETKRLSYGTTRDTPSNGKKS